MGKQNIGNVLNRIQTNKVMSVLLNHRIFLYWYFVVCMLLALPLLGRYVTLISKLCFLWAVVLICWDILTTRRIFKMVYWALPILFLCSYGISVLLNAQYVFVSGCKHLIHSAIFLLLVYEVNATSDKHEIMGLLKNMCALVVAAVTFANLIALCSYLVGISGYVDGIKVGLRENRLYGLYFSPNSGAILSILAILAAVMRLRFFGKMKPWKYGAYVGTIAVQTIYYALTLSKGGDLAALVFLFAFVVVYGFFALRRKVNILPAVLLSAVTIALAIGVYHVTLNSIREGMSYAPAYFAQMTNQHWIDSTKPSEPEDATDPSDATDPTETLPGKVEFVRVEAHSDISNNRFTIWSACLSVMDQAPLFGFVDMEYDGDIPHSKIQLHEGLEGNHVRWLRIADGYMHNSYLQILSYAGGIGLLLILVLAFFVVKYSLGVLFSGNKNTPVFELLAFLFSISAMLALNGVVESHLLFNRQDVIGFLFWYFLGCTVTLARQYRYDADYLPEDADADGALVAATPLQVLHCVEFVKNNIENSAENADLYVVHSFRDAKNLAERVRKTGIFRNVYELQPRTIKHAIQSKFYTFYDLFFPEQALKQKSCGPKIPFMQKNYRYICASSTTTFTIGMHMAFPKSKVYLYDDGIGSYYGSMLHDYNSGLFQLVNKIFFDGALIMKPEAMYINSPELSMSTTPCEKRKLPSVPEDGNALLKEIFAYQENVMYDDHRLVYLTQPFEGAMQLDTSVEEAILNGLKRYRDDVIVRVHPRQADAEFAGLLKDTKANLWELECMQQVSEKNVLISYCSTSQFMPKMLCDREPCIIFTYKLFGSEISSVLQDFLDKFVRMYRNPERIMIPGTLEEFEELLRLVRASE